MQMPELPHVACRVTTDSPGTYCAEIREEKNKKKVKIRKKMQLCNTHRLEEVGGVGTALCTVCSRGLSLVDWSSLAIPRCRDNSVAESVSEAYGADLALEWYH